ncbi:unnamed protein product [Closterium sp. NIES-53]
MGEGDTGLPGQLPPVPSHPLPAQEAARAGRGGERLAAATADAAVARAGGAVRLRPQLEELVLVDKAAEGVGQGRAEEVSQATRMRYGGCLVMLCAAAKTGAALASPGGAGAGG